MPALLPWSTIETLVGRNLMPRGHFRIVVDGNELAQAVYCDREGRPRPELVQNLAAQGATMAINSIDMLVPGIGRLGAVLERALRSRVGVNCYLTFGAGSAFPPHCDAHDVLVLQLHGAKRWSRFGIPFESPVRGSRPAVADPIWEGNMTPGDLLFLPRGEVHSAVPLGRPSVHLTFGLNEPTGADVLRWLATKAADVEILRRGVGPTLTGKGRTLREQELKAALHGLVEDMTIATFLADQDVERPFQSFAPLGMLGPEGVTIGPGDMLVSALRRRLDLVAGEAGEALLLIGQKRIRLSHLARRALTELTLNDPLPAEALAHALAVDFYDSDYAGALEQLARESLISIAI
ncbi:MULTISPECIES: JmjC domain-containing protein [unclassified Sphingomonas]|uniref:JmjC domain-containing protein n=1 Tax=unclassified Sphingomonas TaxID=196159 RepID=UPI0012E333D5|nr:MULTISPECIES: cupin domain-containing protein [unclassified Sphingomonas]